MMTIATQVAAAVESLIQAAAAFSSTATIPMDDVRRVAAQHLSHTPPQHRVSVVLDIAQALTNVELFESGHAEWLQMWPHPDREDVFESWRHQRAEAWRELAHLTAVNAVEADQTKAVA